MARYSILFWRLYNRVSRSFTDSVEYSLPHLHIIGLVGVIGFPLYYWIWSSIFPQPYENLALRLMGSLLFLGLVFVPRWPTSCRPYLKLYWFISFLYALPFFFTFMLLKNDGNTVWAMSTMAGLTLLILIAYDWLLVTMMFAMGSALALLAYAMTTTPWELSNNYWQQLPIYLFVVVAGSVFNYKSIRLNQERLKVLASVGTDLAHELRTPLVTIHNNISGLRRYYPRLLNAYRVAKQNNLIEHPIAANRFRALESALNEAVNEVGHANTIIDMLLVNTGKPNINVKKFAHYWMADVVDKAIARYPFDSSIQRERIQVNSNSDFKFFGSDLLMTHVIFNLINNALTNSGPVSPAVIEITLDQDKHCNYLRFKDYGEGILARELPCIFDYMYTSRKNSDRKGAGIGLAFCKKIMNHFKGSIECDSQYGAYTIFTLSFPAQYEDHHA